MKFLIHGNAPWVRTGYGVQCAQLVRRLVADGHDVAVSSTYGQQGGMGAWQVGDGSTIPVYPCGYDQNGNDVLHNHALHFFGGDPHAGWIIPIIDVWCLINPSLADFQIAAWTPVDHFPVPRDVVAFFHRSGAVPVAMSRFGERELQRVGLDATHAPLSVDTSVYKPTPTLVINGKTVTGRSMIGVPEDAFVVGMVAMNKGNRRDRKGFNEALRAFGVFWKDHQNAVLYVHSDWPGAADGLNLKELATQCSIPPHALVFPDLYAYFPHGFTPEQMAATYTAFDVLLAPSHGEGFCVPLIEAQACGTPVIATDFSAQTELVGSGWLVEGQPEWDHDQSASYICPSIVDVVLKLEAAHKAAGDVVERQRLADRAVGFAAGYDADRVYREHWRPFLASLEETSEPLPLQREPIPETDGIAVIVPAMRPENLERLVASFASSNDGSAMLYLVHDRDVVIDVWTRGCAEAICTGADVTTSFAEKVNAAVELTDQPWLFIAGDDVEFKPGWIQAARELSARFDVIGTNDTDGPVKNPDVAAGRHADHFFVRRAYVDEYGACLDGPKVLAPECYRHWYTDKEVIGLARARGVFTPCLESVVVHHHPGYDGREDLREQDPVYMLAVGHSAEDQKTFRSRLPLIEMQRTSRAKVA